MLILRWSIQTAKGKCEMGWKCRFAGSHMTEKDTDGRKELVLIEKPGLEDRSSPGRDPSAKEEAILNEISTQAKVDLMKRKMQTPKAETYRRVFLPKRSCVIFQTFRYPDSGSNAVP